MFTDIINALSRFTLGDFIDILLMTVILYTFFRLIKDTKAYQMAIGLAIVGLLFLISQWGKFVVTGWLLKTFTTYIIIAIIILFQGELRHLLTSIGSRSFRKPFSLKAITEKIDDVFLAVDFLSAKKIGALIAIEKEISLTSYANRGSRIDGTLSKELLVTLFYPRTPLHDGAVIIRENKILAAGCLLPLPAAHNLGDDFVTRTRHLAALGLSQETDAAVIVVSEEEGSISLTMQGHMHRNLEKDELKQKVLEYLRQR
jgi:diadenylate cyclase